MDFDFVPWGNAYFAAVTGNKTYDRGPGMTSWLEQCGMGVKSPPADCFTGEILCRESQLLRQLRSCPSLFFYARSADLLGGAIEQSTARMNARAT